jgi:hypothetical protein
MAAPLGNNNAAKAKRWAAAIERALDKRSRRESLDALDELAEKLLLKCDEGDMSALKELGDRLDGKSVQGMILAGDSDNPIAVTEVTRRIIDPNETGD